MSKEKSKITYEFTGKEREQLEAMRNQIVALSNEFFAIVSFIAKRDNVEQNSIFDQNKLAFVKEEVVEKKE